MPVLGLAPRRFFFAAGLAITMTVTPVATTALIGADTVPVPRSVAEPGDPGGCSTDEQTASVSLDCAPDAASNAPNSGDNNGKHHAGGPGGPGGAGGR